MRACTAPVCPLTVIAWRLSGLTVTELWWRCLGAGGNTTPTAVGDYLDGGASWTALEHNVLAQVVNEALWDMRCSSLAPHREPDHDAAGMTPQFWKAWRDAP